MISQLTVFLANEKGRLASMCRALANAGVNMTALNIADTEDFGVARILCADASKAVEALSQAGYRARVTPMVAVQVPNVEGGLATLLEFLDAQGVNVEYAYCYLSNNDVAVDVLKVEDAAKVEGALMQAGYVCVQQL